MRVFVAVELPEEVRARVFAASRELVAGLRSARPVAEENLHVTVKFLGEVEEHAVAGALQAARDAAALVPAARAEVRGFGVFPNLRRPHIVWAGVGDPQRVLGRLEAEASRLFEPLGFPREERPFMAHVTVARLRDERGRNSRPTRAVNLVLDDHAPRLGEFPAEHLTVFSSELSPSGSRYRALGRFPLQPTPSKEQT